ncbi:hypothetical protein L7F22_004110 [Adiantum nelumboides]|nr:hypothetical protein [Adiantum nelumboides]
MPPHIFHALSDDPARQFGCMAALFHLLHHNHPRKRTMPAAPHSPPSAALHDLSKARGRNKRLDDKNYIISSKEHAGKIKDSSASKNHSDTKRKPSPEKLSNRYKRNASLLDSPTTSSKKPAPAPLSHEELAGAVVSSHSSSRCELNESASIFSSSRRTNYTIRESPQRCLAHKQAAQNDYESDMQNSLASNSASSFTTHSGSSPSSPAHHVPLAQALREARRSTPARSAVCKALFVDKPRAAPTAVDEELRVQQGRSHDLCSKINGENSRINDSLCNKQPPAPAIPSLLDELEESVKALKQFVDGFDTRYLSGQQNVKPAKKSNLSSLGWWSNAKSKSRLFKSAYHNNTDPHKCTSNSILNDEAACNNIELAPAAARTSSFDYNEAVRISQKIEETPARLSLDGRELVPRAVMKLREALRLGHIQINKNAEALVKFPGMETSEPKSTTNVRWPSSKSAAAHVPVGESAGCNLHSSKGRCNGGQRSNVIARLMGLDSLSSPSEENLSGGIADCEGTRSGLIAEGPSLMFEDLLIQCPQRPKLDQPGSCVLKAAEQINDIDVAAATSSRSVPKVESAPLIKERKSSAFVSDYTNLQKTEASSCHVLDNIIQEDHPGRRTVLITNESRSAKRSCSPDQERSSKPSSTKAVNHMRHDCKIEVMPASSARLPLSCRQSSAGSGRRVKAASAAHKRRDQQCLEEDKAVRRHSATNEAKRIPCRIVVIEPRNLTRINSPIDKFTTHSEKGTTNYTARLRSDNALPDSLAGLVDAAGRHKHITESKSANVNYLSLKRDRSSNLCDSSRKRDTKQHTMYAHDKRKSAQNHTKQLQLEAGPKRLLSRSPKELVSRKQPTSGSVTGPEGWKFPAGASYTIEKIKPEATLDTQLVEEITEPLKVVESGISCLDNSAATSDRSCLNDLVGMTGIAADYEQNAIKYTYDGEKSMKSAGDEQFTEGTGGNQEGAEAGEEKGGAYNCIAIEAGEEKLWETTNLSARPLMQGYRKIQGKKTVIANMAMESSSTLMMTSRRILSSASRGSRSTSRSCAAGESTREATGRVPFDGAEGRPGPRQLFPAASTQSTEVVQLEAPPTSISYSSEKASVVTYITTIASS